MPTVEEQLLKYREAARLRHKAHKKHPRAGRADRRARDEMREIAMDVCGRSAEAPAYFAELLSEHEPGYVRRWAAFHVLEMCQVDDALEVQAIRAVEEGKSGDSLEAVGEEVWLRRWRASRGTREQAVAALCRFPVDYRASQTLSPVDLVRASRYKALQPSLSVDELEACLHSSPELADAWLLYSEDQRCSPAWFVAERSPSQYEVGCYPDGQSVWFTDRLRAVAEYALRQLRAIGEIAG
jgi:hypothetical protein